MTNALPMTNPPAPSAQAGDEPQGKRILVVDDNVDAAESAAEILRLLGSDVSVVHDGLAALVAVEKFHPDIVLLDIGLPGIDGYEVARRLRLSEHGKDVMLVALTGWGQEQDRQRTSASGFDQHWVKPVGLEKLKEISPGKV